MLYSWKFTDIKERGQLWYIIVFSIIIWLVIWWFITKQYWMSFVIILLTGIIFYTENNSSDEINIKITELWIKIEMNFYDFSKIDSFTLIYEWENAVLLRLQLNKKWIKIIDLKIDNTVALKLKEILPNFIKENKKEDLSLIEKIIRILKI